MRAFDYKKYQRVRWDNEIVDYISAISFYQGRQELYLKQQRQTLKKLIEIAKVPRHPMRLRVLLPQAPVFVNLLRKKLRLKTAMSKRLQAIATFLISSMRTTM